MAPTSLPTSTIADARGRGEQLTPEMKRGAWAATQSSHHEALHGVNPIDPGDYTELELSVRSRKR